MVLKKLLPCLVLILSYCTALAQQYRTGLDVRVPFISGVATLNKRTVIFYELLITNLGSDTIDLKTLEITSGIVGELPMVLDKNELDRRFSRFGPASGASYATLPGGSSGIVYIEVMLDNRNTTRLTSSFKYVFTGQIPRQNDSVTNTTVNIPHSPQLVLGSPLRGGPRATVYQPSWPMGYRRVVYTINGHAYIPGRFAIDFFKLDKYRKLAHRDADTVNNWFGYGAEVLAVADGIVGSVRNDFVEPPTVRARERVTAERATGNYLSIKLSAGEYVFYEHLKPGSIRVRPGEKVKKGQVIASLGFTGQTSGPHLHFHIANADSPLAAEGIPFAFEHFSWIGSLLNVDNMGKTSWIPINRTTKANRRKERPCPNAVITF